MAGLVRGEPALPEQHGDVRLAQDVEVSGESGVRGLGVVEVRQRDDQQAEPDAFGEQAQGGSARSR